jgi:hypothetical protein
MKINGVDTASIVKINGISKASVKKVSGVGLSPIPAGTVLSNLIMYLDAGVSASYPGSGTTWTDITYNGNNGTLVNGPTYDSHEGGSLLFDGVDDYVGLTNVNITIPSGLNFVLNAWIKTPSILAGYKMILSTDQYYIYLALFNNQFAFDARGYPVVRFGTLSPDTWYNVTIVRDADVDYRYINGVLIDTNPNAMGIGGNYAVGKWNFNNTLFYDSNISVISMYNEAINGTGVLQNFNTLKSRYGY